MHRNELSIATITWARDEEEEKLLRKSVEQLGKLDIRVFITDGGSNTGFLEFLRGFPQFVLAEAKTSGLWAQAKSSLLKAYESGSAFILYTEPDKYQFFSNGLKPMFDGLIVDDQTGIITASRSVAGLASFPAFQQMTETTINNCCAEITGHQYDYSYGPFLMNRQLIPYLLQLQEEIGWGWRPFCFVAAHRLGYRLEEWISDFLCPAEQQEDNPIERVYRMHQLSQSVKGIVLATSIPLNV
ncbi:MAG: hypothetical protein WKF97_25905 [Chitinophagaceae bacterium]